MSEPPKLFAHKPKKGNVANGFSPLPASTPPPPPLSAKPLVSVPVKESFARRYKFLWPLLLGVNVTIGAYLYMRTKKKDASDVAEAAAEVAGPSTELVPPVTENTAPSTTTTLPVSTPATTPVAEDQQRELFKWILDEKRKMETKDVEEKKLIDSEKAVLKQFIRAKSVPII